MERSAPACGFDSLTKTFFIIGGRPGLIKGVDDTLIAITLTATSVSDADSGADSLGVTGKAISGTAEFVDDMLLGQST